MKSKVNNRTQLYSVQNTKNIIIYYFIGCVLSFSISLSILSFMELDFSYKNDILVQHTSGNLGIILIATTVLIAMLIMFLLFYNWKTLLLGSGIFISLGLIYLVYAWQRKINLDYNSRIIRLITWSKNFIIHWSRDFIKPDTYQKTFIIILSILITFLIYMLLIKWFNIYVIIGVSSLSFVYFWLLVKEVQLHSYYMYLSSLLILYMFHVNNTKNKEKNNQEKYTGIARIFLLSVPIIAVSLLFTSSLPKKEYPIQFPWLDKKINRIHHYFNQRKLNEKFDYFSLTSIGFNGENSRLGGRIIPNNEQVLTINASHSDYLRGASKNHYTGSMWLDTIDEEKQAYNDVANNIMNSLNELQSGDLIITTNNDMEIFFDFVENENFIEASRLIKKSLNSFYDFQNEWTNEGEMQITYTGIETKTMFLPMYASLVGYDDTDKLYVVNNDIVNKEKNIRTDESYELNFKFINYKNEDLVDLLRKSKKNTYQDLNEKIQKLMALLINQEGTDDVEYSQYNLLVNNLGVHTEYMDYLVDINSVFKANSDYIYSNYLSLPEELPQRVMDLAKEITENAETDYDKIKSIEKYFKKDFIYTLEPKNTPRNEDFVDYFLFEQKEGYCTYYATSMAVLARAIGLPTRYVEGFVMPKSSMEEDNLYILTKNNAHAWVEVYFEGAGWIPFEPTPPFIAARYPDSSFEGLVSSSMNMNDMYADYMDMINEYYNEDTDFYEYDFSISVKNETPIPNILKKIGIVLVLSILLININIYIYRRIMARKIKDNKTFRKQFVRILRILDIAGFKMKPGETLYEYAHRMDKLYMVNNIGLLQVTDIYNKVFYGYESISEEDIHLSKEFFSNVTKQIIQDMTKTKLIINRFIIPRI